MVGTFVLVAAGAWLTRSGLPRTLERHEAAEQGRRTEFAAPNDDVALTMLHPWKCKLGHENVTDVPEAAIEGARHRFVLRCTVPECRAKSWILVGSTPGHPTVLETRS